LLVGGAEGWHLATRCWLPIRTQPVTRRRRLHAISRGHVRHSYSEVWEILEEADEDPGNPDNVIDFCTGRPIAKADRDRGGNTPDAWIRGPSRTAFRVSRSMLCLDPVGRSWPEIGGVVS
jgi:hypothetical protein